MRKTKQQNWLKTIFGSDKLLELIKKVKTTFANKFNIARAMSIFIILLLSVAFVCAGNVTVQIGDLNIDGNVTAANLNIANWDTAYSWGDHALVGYLTSESDPTLWNTLFNSTGDARWLDDTDTVDGNASSICSGTTTYLDGEGNCDDISGVYVQAADWTTVDNYPSACTAGQYVTQIGDTLTCDTPSYTTDTDTNASTVCSGNQVLLGNATCYSSSVFFDDTTIGNCSVDGSCSLITYDSELTYTVDSSAHVNCSTDEVFLGNGSCTSSALFFDDTDTDTTDYTNIAMTNKSNVFGAFAQTFDTNVLVVDSTNNRVGVLDSTPDYGFECDGTSDFGDTMTIGDGAWGRLTFGGSDFKVQGLSGKGLMLSGGASSTDFLRITSAGLVETVAPIPIIKFKDRDHSIAETGLMSYLTFWDENDVEHIWFGDGSSSSNTFYFNNHYNGFSFGTDDDGSAVERMTIDVDGNVNVTTGNLSVDDSFVHHGNQTVHSYVPRFTTTTDRCGDTDESPWNTTGNWIIDGWDLSSIVPEGTKAVQIRFELQDGVNAAGRYFTLRHSATYSYNKIKAVLFQLNIPTEKTEFVALDSDRKLDYWATDVDFDTICATVVGYML